MKIQFIRSILLLTLTLCVILTAQPLHGQHADNKNALSLRYVLPNYQFQIDNEFASGDFTSGAQLAYTRHINDIINLEFPLTIAQANYPLDSMYEKTFSEIVKMRENEESTYSASHDDDVFKHLALTYAKHNPVMRESKEFKISWVLIESQK